MVLLLFFLSSTFLLTPYFSIWSYIYCFLSDVAFFFKNGFSISKLLSYDIIFEFYCDFWVISYMIDELCDYHKYNCTGCDDGNEYGTCWPCGFLNFGFKGFYFFDRRLVYALVRNYFNASICMVSYSVSLSFSS